MPKKVKKYEKNGRNPVLFEYNSCSNVKRRKNRRSA